MGLIQKGLKLILTADTKKAEKEFAKIGKQFEGMGKKAKQAGLLIAGFVLAIGTKAVIAASKFEKSMASISTLIDTSTESMEDMKKEVLALSKKTPVALEDLSAALYDVRSAGIAASEAMEVLEAASKLAVAGLGSTKEATNILTSAINSFEMDAGSANKTADIFFKAVKAGKTTVRELAQGFGQVAPLANAMGVEFEELIAMTSAMTTSGLQASTAYRQIRATLSNLAKPTEEMQDLMNKLNIENLQAEIQNNGLQETILKLAAATGGNNEMLAKAFGSVEALNAVMMLMGETGETVTEILNDMTSATNDLDLAFIKQTATFDAQYQMLKNQVNVEFIKLGTKIMPHLIEGMKLLPFVLEVLTEWWNNLTGAISNFIIKVDKAYIAAQKLSNTLATIATLGLAKPLGLIKEPVSPFGLEQPSDAPMSYLGFAKGGIVTKPTNALIGEAGPEAVIPLKRGGGLMGNNIYITGTFLSEDAAEKVGDLLIDKLKMQGAIG